MDRRQFLGRAAAAAVALRTGRALAASGRRVVVVGAGLAGLVASEELRRAGIDVQVVEGRKVTGGRIRTIRGVFQDSQYGEAGGELVDASHTAMRSWIRRLGLRLVPAHDSRSVVYVDGGRRRVDAGVEREVGRFWARVEALGVRPIPALDARSAQTLIDTLRLSGETRFLVEHELRQRFSVEPRNLSLLHLVTHPRPKGPSFRIAGGSDRLIEALAVPLGHRLSLHAQVSAISWSGDGVAVRAGGHTLHADACVLAVPLPPLRDVRFHPSLPSRVASAVKELRYGLGTKTLAQYDHRFWRPGSGAVVTDLTFQRSWEATERQPGPRGILAFSTPGSFGAVYAKVSKSTRVVLAAGELDDVYPGSLALQERGASSAWDTEDLSGGTFVAYAPGQVTRFRDVLRRPVGRLYLAGEHADAHTGTMEGAVRSGQRVAAAVVRELRR